MRRALVYLLIISKKRCLPPHKHPDLHSRGLFDGRQTRRLPKRFTATGSRDGSRDLVGADRREVSAEVERCPGWVGRQGGTGVQLLLLPSVPEVHGERMTSGEDTRYRNLDGGKRFGWCQSHICWPTASLSGSKVPWRVREEAGHKKRPSSGNIRQKRWTSGYGNREIRPLRDWSRVLQKGDGDTNTRRGRIRWKVRAAALNRW